MSYMNPVERSSTSFDTTEPQFITLKCVVVGDGAVGKTSMLLCYTTNAFPTDHMPTIFDNYSKNVTIDDGRVVNLGLWDTAGQDEYADFRPLSYSAADCFVVAFSLIDRESFKNVEQKWLQELRAKASKTPIVLVGTKLDLREQMSSNNNNGGGIGGFGGSGFGSRFGRDIGDDDRAGNAMDQVISEKEGQALARKIKAVSYVECSSLVQTNLSLVFDEVIEAHVNPAVVKIEEPKGCCAIM
jgi:Ras-related C3 botulinum toxin substrate 1